MEICFLLGLERRKQQSVLQAIKELMQQKVFSESSLLQISPQDEKVEGSKIILAMYSTMSKQKLDFYSTETL